MAEQDVLDAIAALATEVATVKSKLNARSLAAGQLADIPQSAWRRQGVMISPDQPWEMSPDGWGSMAESSLVNDENGWHLWYHSGGLAADSAWGMGYATADSALGPWKKYVPALQATSLNNASFESGSGEADSWVPDGWLILENVGGIVRTNQVAGRTGGYGVRVQYTAQAGDTGKYLMVYQTVGGGSAMNEQIKPSVWAKGSVTGGCTLGLNPICEGSGEEFRGDFTPTTSWQQFSMVPPAFATTPGVNGDVDLRLVRVYFASDTGSVDFTLDDATFEHGVTSPVKPRCINGLVVKVGAIFHMFFYKGGDIWQSASADGIVWGQDTLAVTHGAGGQWDQNNIWNSCPFMDSDGTWYLYYESDEFDTFNTGVATADDITGPWTKYGGNPLIDFCHPSVFKVDGKYVMYGHGGVFGLPGNSVLRAVGDTPFDFARDQDPVFPRVGADEGEGLAAAQASDVSVYNDGYNYVMYYTANSSFDASVGHQCIKAMTASPADISLAPQISSAASADAKLDAVQLKTDTIPASPAAVGSAMTLTSGERTSLATSLWTSAERVRGSIVGFLRT